MDLRAKCVRELAGSADGERLLVSRVRPSNIADEQVDGWERRLAPSAKIDFALYRRWITWREYAALYAQEMRPHEPLLRAIGERAKAQAVTLVCTCGDTHRCHRELLVRLIMRWSTTPAPVAASTARPRRRRPTSVHAMA